MLTSHSEPLSFDADCEFGSGVERQEAKRSRLLSGRRRRPQPPRQRLCPLKSLCVQVGASCARPARRVKTARKIGTVQVCCPAQHQSTLCGRAAGQGAARVLQPGRRGPAKSSLSGCTGFLCERGTCVLGPTCNDGVVNGYETGVDCGGGTCARCDFNQVCVCGGGGVRVGGGGWRRQTSRRHYTPAVLRSLSSSSTAIPDIHASSHVDVPH